MSERILPIAAMVEITQVLRHRLNYPELRFELNRIGLSNNYFSVLKVIKSIKSDEDK